MAQAPRTLRQWLDDRFMGSSLLEALAKRSVPSRNPAYYVGGIALFALFLQIATGILLVLHYEPGAATAYPSTLKLVGQVPFGDVIHGVHVWSADVLVASMIVHLFSVLLRRTFVPPREMVWVTGMLLLITVIGMAFTGLILPWSQSSVIQARVGSEMASKVPLIGEWLKQLMRGGDQVNAMTLQHAFGFHVAVMPATVTLLLAIHGLALRRRAAPSSDGTPTMPVYPDFLVRMAAVWVAVFVVILSLALFADRSLGSPADLAAASPSGARPPWYFLFVHELLRAAPPQLVGLDSARFIVGAGSVIFLVALCLPFLDRRGSRVTAVVAGLLLLFATVMTLYGLA